MVFAGMEAPKSSLVAPPEARATAAAAAASRGEIPKRSPSILLSVPT